MRAKKLTALLLALLMTVPGFVSCGDSAPADTGTSAEAGTADAAPAENEVPEETEPDILDGLNYGGTSFRIRTSDTTISSNYLIEGSGELNGDVVNDTVFERNLEVAETLNVKFEYIHTNNNWDKVYQEIQTLIMSGDAGCDLIIDDQRGMSTASIDRMFIDGATLETMNFAENCWWDSYMKNLSIDYKSIYLLAGDYFMDVLNRSQALLYNRDMYRDLYGDPDDLYKTVAEGKWTYDAWLPLIEGAYMDVNGNTNPDADDTYGMIVGGVGGSVFPYVYGTDIPYVSRDENGYPTLTMYCDRLIDLYNNVYNLFYNSGTRTDYTENGEDLHTKFRSAGALFISGTGLGDFGKFRDMEAEIGIIPNPKLDEAQDTYRTVVWDTAELGAIPITAPDPVMSGAVVQMLCRVTHETLLPAYYETSLKVKYARDDYTSGMIDLIYNGIADMFCIVYGGAYANDIFTWAILGPLQRKEDSITSEYQKREKPAVKSLQRLVEAYQEMAVPELPAP
ncbi:MAG: hypothetical protein II333_11870 [Clostridia bacterium]|nr:hypothetical protein [Clostridia bacterium]